MTSSDYERARRHLMRRDRRLGAVIKQVGPCRLQDIPDLPPFMALAEAIASQQLSVKAADTIFGRLCDLFGPDRQPDPVRLLALEEAALRAAGFSRSKVVFLRDLAAHVVEKRLDLDRMHEHDDVRVLEHVNLVQAKLGGQREIHIISGFRSPEFNAMLVRSGRRAAKNSLHVQGQAVDLQIPGVHPKMVRQAALQLEYGGVGYYPRSKFVHLDSGPLRHW